LFFSSFHTWRREFWKKDNELDQQSKNIKAELQKAEHQLQSTVAKNVSAGLIRVNNITREFKNRIKGNVYGPLIELFECDDIYMPAVEVAAGGRFVLLNSNRYIYSLPC
jgi:chromosome segregation ATPase